MNSEGAGWLDLSDIPAETLLELEIGLFQEGALQGVSLPKLSVAQAILKLTNYERKTKMEKTATERINETLAELHLANKMLAEMFGLDESEDN